jgi:hypothetical protein
MALGTFAPGVHAATFNGQDCGLTTSQGWRLRYRPSVKKIQDTNAYGDTLIDGIFRGYQGVQLLVTFKEWIAAVKAAINPYGTAVGGNMTFDGIQGQIGLLSSDLAKVLILTAQANSPAAATGTTPLTANKAILSPENDVEILFGPDERDIPVVFDLLLYDDSGTKRFFKIGA